MKQKLLFLLLALLPSAITRAAVGDYFDSDNVTYHVTSESPNEVTVYSYVTMPSGVVDIPETVKNGTKTYTVTAIGPSAFFDCVNMTKVFIPDTVTSIGANAFFDCKKVTDVYCLADPSKLTWNGDSGSDFKKSKATVCHVFDPKAWDDFTHVNVTFADFEKDDMFTYGGMEYQVRNVASKTLTLYLCDLNPKGDFVIPSHIDAYRVKVIGTSAFQGCSNMTSVTIPGTVDIIEENAFKGCTKVEDVYFYTDLLNEVAWSDNYTDDFKADGSTLCHVRPDSKWGKVSHVNVTFVPDLYDVDDHFVVDDVIYGVTSLNPKEVMVLGADAPFKVTIPENVNGFTVTGIYQYSFIGSKLKEIIIPHTVTSIGSEAFSGCSLLTSVIIADDDDNGSPSTLTSIGNEAFFGCANLKSIRFPASLTSIEADAFLACTGMTDVYCYANPTALTWNEDECDDFMEDGSTKFHVANASAWSGFGDVNVTFVGDLMNPVLTDDAPYTRNFNAEVTSATYQKTIAESRVGKYQAWMVPFDYTITEDDVTKFDFYEINMIANAPAPGEETSDGMWVFLTKKGAGKTFYANRPYVYKPKVAVTDGYAFTTAPAVLKARTSADDYILKTETAEDIYSFYATYENTNATIINKFYYVNINGGLSYGTADVTVGPYRWIIRRESKYGDEPGYVKEMHFVDGEEDGETGISLTPDPSPGRGEIYNLAGQMVNGKWVNGKWQDGKWQDGKLPKGIYIVSGKKILVK